MPFELKRLAIFKQETVSIVHIWTHELAHSVEGE